MFFLHFLPFIVKICIYIVFGISKNLPSFYTSLTHACACYGVCVCVCVCVCVSIEKIMVNCNSIYMDWFITQIFFDRNGQQKKHDV